MSSCSDSHCVCRVVKEIVVAQDQVNKNQGGHCATSCEQSIKQLLSPESNNNMNRFSTIPFILYCKESCKPFIGSGVYQSTLNNSNNNYFGCVETPIFRAKEFVNNTECCVKLELLQAVDEGGNAVENGDNVCDFFPGNTRREFQATGICITVDLNSFNAITCLDPVDPLSSSQFPKLAAN